MGQNVSGRVFIMKREVEGYFLDRVARCRQDAGGARRELPMLGGRSDRDRVVYTIERGLPAIRPELGRG